MARFSKKPNQQMRFTILFASVLILFLFFHMLEKPVTEVKNISFSDFLSAVQAPETSTERVVEVTFEKDIISGKKADGSMFSSYGPYDSDLRKLLETKNIAITFKPEEATSWWKEILIHSLPIIIFVLIFIFFMRQLQIGGGKAMSFGKSKAKMINENDNKVTFKDVAGVDEAKEELEEIIEFLRDPKKFTRLGGRIPKGVLLVGPPGTGKTLLAKAVAGEAGVPFFSISGSDFVEMFVGVGASRVRDLFEQAKKHAPCIVFVDEIDAVGRHRGAGMGGGHDEREQTLNQLLVEMDGFEANEGVILIAATNRVDVLDPALLRPGRFDRRVVVSTPDIKGREKILKVHTRKTPLADNVKLRIVAQGTPGFSGADLQNLVNEAALIAARENASNITNRHFDLAKDKVIMGPARKSMIMGDKEKNTTAFHEAGHAIVAKSIPEADPVHKVTIIPRGMALGVTMMLPDEDRLSLSKTQAEAMIAYAMGGRAAEELVFNHYTTGASDDIKRATDIARKMVCNWGMSEKLGPLSLSNEGADPFMGREFGKSKSHSNKLEEEIDEEIQRIVKTGYERAMKILKEKRTILDKLAHALIIKETIDTVDLDRAFKGLEILTDEDIQRYDENKTKTTAAASKEAEEEVENKGTNLGTPFPAAT